MSKRNKNATPKKKKPLKTSSKVLYVIAIIVLLIPLLLLGYIYLGAKENSGKPVVENRFQNSLDPAITSEEIEKVKEALSFKKVDKVVVQLTSATLRIHIDTADDMSEAEIKKTMNAAYDKVSEILPIKTYFTNKNGMKMYDLDIHVYNFIPTEENADQQIYMEKTKNAANEKAVVDVLSKPRNEKEAQELLKQQVELEKKK